MEEDSRILDKINSQLNEFCGRISEGLSKSKKRFIYQVVFGIQASRDVKLSEVSRSLEEEIRLIKTENRLSRNMSAQGLSEHINERLIRQGAVRIDKDMVLGLDLTAIEKPYAKKMDYLATVWDGLKKEKVRGYWGLEVVGANISDNYVLPLYGELYSCDADGFESENKQILKAIDTVNAQAKGKGIWVMDRGGDRKELINSILSKDLRFIIRMKLQRLLTLGNNQEKPAQEVADKFIDYAYAYDLEIDNQGVKEKRKVFLGTKRVKINGVEKELMLVAIKGFSDKPMLLLTNAVKPAAIILEMYLTRWKVEESIRFLKQEYGLKDVRVRNYESLKNTMALLSAVFYFLSVYLGRKLKLSILIKKICEKAKRFFQIPAFNQYALADGIHRLMFNVKWVDPFKRDLVRKCDKQLALGFMRV